MQYGMCSETTRLVLVLPLPSRSSSLSQSPSLSSPRSAPSSSLSPSTSSPSPSFVLLLLLLLLLSFSLPFFFSLSNPLLQDGTYRLIGGSGSILQGYYTGSLQMWRKKGWGYVCTNLTSINQNFAIQI